MRQTKHPQPVKHVGEPSNGLQTKAIAYQSKQELVYSALKEAIIFCSIPPGERLVIRDLAASLGVSETPVRMAIGRLASERLVQEVAYAGGVVTSIGYEETRDLHAILEALQGLAAERAAVRRTDDDVARLRAVLEELENLSSDTTYEKFLALNNRFHTEIAVTSGISTLPEMTVDLLSRVGRANNFHIWRESSNPILWSTQSHRASALVEHRKILQAIERRRPEAARTAVAEHYARSMRDFEQHLAEMRRIREGNVGQVSRQSE